MHDSLDLSTAYPEVLLLVGSRSDVAGAAVRGVLEVLSHHGFDVTVRPLASVREGILLDYSQAVVVTDAEQPGTTSADSMIVQEHLLKAMPDLSHLAYGMVLVEASASGFEHTADTQVRHTLDMLAAVEVYDAFVVAPNHAEVPLRSVQAWGLDLALAFADAFAPTDEEMAA